ncbi:dephospho-CoA kinase [Bacillus sp. TS-2]|nr:dephospho-CoA kinase [Bacillus sp. TS-2]
MSLIIGLTGGIASGKSTVSNYLKNKEIPIVDADQIARQVVEPGQPAYLEIVNHFGTDILLPSKQINRPKLGKLIFDDEQKRLKLNDIVHPAVRSQMLLEKEHYQKQDHQQIVMDIPLLYESQLFYLVDRVLLVYVDENVQLQRLMQRNQYDRETALARIHSQWKLIDKKKRADAIIDNNGSLEATYQQIETILKMWS